MLSGRRVLFVKLPVSVNQALTPYGREGSLPFAAFSYCLLPPLAQPSGIRKNISPFRKLFSFLFFFSRNNPKAMWS
jgi:hypothetical protein